MFFSVKCSANKRCVHGAHGAEEQGILRALFWGELGVRDEAGMLLLRRVLYRTVLPSGRLLFGKPRLVTLFGGVALNGAEDPIASACALPVRSVPPCQLGIIADREAVRAIDLVRRAGTSLNLRFVDHAHLPFIIVGFVAGFGGEAPFGFAGIGLVGRPVLNVLSSFVKSAGRMANLDKLRQPGPHAP
jgi:hypothetical protein